MIQHSVFTILSQADIFDSMSKTQLEMIAAIGELLVCQEAEILVRENDRSDELYVIGAGHVEVLIDPSLVTSQTQPVPQMLVVELGAGQVFGEVALVDQGMRSATVRVSRRDTAVVRISRQRLMLLCDTYPELGYKLMKNLAADLALKIRQTDLTLRQYQLLLAKA